MSSRGFDSKAASPVPTVNIPYFEMLELGGKDEMLDSVVAYVERDLADLPSDLPILAVCAMGDNSEFVAQGLRRLGYASANLKGGMKAWGRHALWSKVRPGDLPGEPACARVPELLGDERGEGDRDRSTPPPPSLLGLSSGLGSRAALRPSEMPQTINH